MDEETVDIEYSVSIDMEWDEVVELPIPDSSSEPDEEDEQMPAEYNFFPPDPGDLTMFRLVGESKGRIIDVGEIKVDWKKVIDGFKE